MAEAEENTKLPRRRGRPKKQSFPRLPSKNSQELFLEGSAPFTDLNLVENKIEQLQKKAEAEKEPTQKIEKNNIENKPEGQSKIENSLPGVLPSEGLSSLPPFSFPKGKGQGENTADFESERQPKAMNMPQNTAADTLKKTIEKQSKEQRSLQKILSVFLFSFVALFCFILILAVYGAVVIFQKIHTQDVLITEVEKKLQGRIDQLDGLVFQQKKEIDELGTSLNQLHSYITDTQKDLSKIRSKIDGLESKIAEHSQNLQQISADIKQDKQNRLKKEEILLKRISLLEEERTKASYDRRKAKASFNP